MAKRVVILGGGVAGLSAAHELIERGFEVHVLEKNSIPGGKARSVPVPDSAKDGRRPLPGEHGFRFFPRFYKHLPDTMSRIPFGRSSNVAENLVETTRLEYPRVGQAPIVAVDRFPTTWDDFRVIINDLHARFGFAPGELEFFADRLWQIATSCEPRRLDEYERLDWWTYVQADSRSDAYKKYLATGLTRSLNAAKARLASTKTIGDILLQLVLDIVTPGMSSDRLLNGPTNDVWIDPWLAYLRKKRVVYELNVTLDSFSMSKGRISGANVIGPDGPRVVTGDYYISAVPIEQMAPRITDEMLDADPTLQGIKNIRENVQWMNGIQFYLTEDVPIVHGHELYADSAWALTSVSQAQFWKNYDFTKIGDGTIRGILSVDISEWEVKGNNGKAAMDCTRDEIAVETWLQIKQSLNHGDVRVVPDEMPRWYLDPDIQPVRSALAGRKAAETDMEPLLVNYINSWDDRPDAYTRIPNLFLAADYVRTFTDLATMEGANEAARRAVNGIIDRSDSNAAMCELWKLHEPLVLLPWRLADQKRYDSGLPWNGTIELPHSIGRFFK
jgi:15-cis-phytoene desaturase